MQKNAAKGRLNLIPLGNVDPMALSVIAAHLQALMGLNTDIASVREKPDFAYLPGRRQYDGAGILGALAENCDHRFQMGVIEHDLCTPILTYVYGESQLGGRAAVVSLYRLKHYERRIVYERAAKISLHEVGHLFGIGHCWQGFCLMRFASTLSNLDGLPLKFCSACEYEISRRLKTLGPLRP